MAARPNDLPDLEPGTVLGARYLLEAPANASGGIATYRALRDETRVSLAALPAGLLEGPADHRLFIEAGRAAGRVPSNHVVPVLDAGVDPDLAVPFVVSEGAAGQSKEELVAAQGVLEPCRAAAVLADAARGVLDAQRTGVVHGDLSPGRILIGPRAGQTVVRLLGYGLAPELRRKLEGAPGEERPRARVAARAQRFGSDVREDLLELGHALVFALTGPETTGTLRSEIAEREDEEIPELLEALPGAGSWPESLKILLSHLLVADPERRPYRADAVATVLSAAASGREIRAEQVLRGARVMPDLSELDDEGPGAAAAWAVAADAEAQARRRRRNRRLVLLLAGLALAGVLFLGVSLRLGNILRPDDLPLFGILRPIPPPTEVEGLTIEQVHGVFEREHRSLHPCRALDSAGRPPPIPLRVQLEISPDGSIRSLVVDGAPPDQQPIADCVREAISRWTFPEPFERLARIQHRVWMDQL